MHAEPGPSWSPTHPAQLLNRQQLWSSGGGASLLAALTVPPFSGVGQRGWRRCECPAAHVLTGDLEGSGSTNSRFAEQGE